MSSTTLSTSVGSIVSSILTLSKKFAASIVGFVFRNESLESCIFSYARDLPIEDECSSDMLIWLLPLLRFLTSTATRLSVVFFPLSILLPGLGVIFHISTSIVLRRGCMTHLDLGSIYSFNPLVIFAAIVSPVPSLLHFLLAVMNYSALRGLSTLMYCCIALLTIGHFPFICIVPAYMLLVRGAAEGRQRSAEVTTETKKSRHIAEIPILFSLCFISFFLAWVSSDYMDDQNSFNCLQKFVAVTTEFCRSQYRNFSNRNIANYEPAASLTWYLDVQVFGRFSVYFLRLKSCQVFLFFVPLLFRMSRDKPLHTANVTVVVVMYCRRETCYPDMLFLATLLLTHHSDSVLSLQSHPYPLSNVKPVPPAASEKTVSGTASSNNTVASHSGMRYLPLMCLCVIGSSVLSPLMLSLWTVSNTGNANFLFFQGLILSLFFALAIIEFSNQIVREIDGE